MALISCFRDVWDDTSNVMQLPPLYKHTSLNLNFFCNFNILKRFMNEYF